ncbi:MAG: hypothetical protein QOJ23_5705 [Actinomycetota bacterium]|nr:hypothetical protein [Actinomycetota bacterium]
MSRQARTGRAARSIAAAIALGLLAFGPGALAQGSGGLNKHPMPTRDQPGPGQAGHAGGASAKIRYHNGPIMLGTTNAYVIWYGDWSGSQTPALVEQFLGRDIGGSPYFNINTSYTDATGIRVTNAVRLVGSIRVGYPKGTTLSDGNVQEVVADAVTSGALPTWTPTGITPSKVPDPNGLYFVLTSKDVGESSGFLTQYCGWHDFGAVAGIDTKYAFVGDASKNLSVCAGQTAASPNNNPAGDAMISVIAHELEEAVTDPDLSAWYDPVGNENADKCAWNYGTMSTLADGARYNMTMNGRRYLIQQNWLNVGNGACAQSY